MADTSAPVPSYIAAGVRTALSFVGGFAVAKGYVTAEQLPEVGGVAVALLTLAWSLMHKIGVKNALQTASQAGHDFRP